MNVYLCLIFIGLIINTNVQSQRINVTHFTLNKGMKFSPKDRVRSNSIIMTSRTATLTQCVKTCMNMLPICRLFEYDSDTLDCRLFEDDTTTGEIITSTSLSNSVLGMIEFKSEFFVKYGQSCSQCNENHFFKCINNILVNVLQIHILMVVYVN